MEIRFDADPPDREELARALGLDSANDPEFAARAGQLAEVAFGEVAAWLTGRERIGTLSEIERRRVLALYSAIRRQPATVERLVDELGFSESRARTMVSRLRYSDARALRALAFREAHDDLQERLEDADEVQQMKRVRLRKATYEAVREAESEILLAPRDRYPNRKMIDVTPRRYDASCIAPDAMWQYVIAWLDGRAGEIGA